MLTKILNNIREFNSQQAPQGTARNKWKGGFTIVELMVVIIIVNLLSGVAIPKTTELIEKSKERVDMLKLFYLRDAIDRALYEDDVHNITEGTKCGDVQSSKSDLDKYLSSKNGVSLFVIEKHSVFETNYQGVHRNAKENNMCGLVYDGGFWNTALKEAGFEAVAAIVSDRANGNNFNRKSALYTTKDVKTDGGSTWTRTFPTNPIFKSKALSSDYNSKGENQSRITMRARWKNCDPNSHSVDVFFMNEATKKPLQGVFTTFATMADFNAKGCK